MHETLKRLQGVLAVFLCLPTALAAQAGLLFTYGYIHTTAAMCGGLTPAPTGVKQSTTDVPSQISIEERQKKCKALFVDGEVASGWKRLSEPQFYVGKNIFEYIDGYGEIPLSYDFQLVGTAQYVEAKTGAEVALDIYDMKTSEDAFGLYSFERSPEAEFLSIGEQGWFSRGSVAFWKGNYYVRLDALQEEKKERLFALAKAVANKITTRSFLPENLHHLLFTEPEKYVPNSLKFFHQKVALDNIHYLGVENVLNLSKDTDVLVADYRDGQEGYKLFLVSYPDDKKAEEAFVHYREHVLQLGYQFTPSRPFASLKGRPIGTLEVQTEESISKFSAIKSGLSACNAQAGAEPVAVFHFKRFVGGAWGGGTVEMGTKTMRKLLGRIKSESPQPSEKPKP